MNKNIALIALVALIASVQANVCPCTAQVDSTACTNQGCVWQDAKCNAFPTNCTGLAQAACASPNCWFNATNNTCQIFPGCGALQGVAPAVCVPYGCTPENQAVDTTNCTTKTLQNCDNLTQALCSASAYVSSANGESVCTYNTTASKCSSASQCSDFTTAECLVNARFGCEVNGTVCQNINCTNVGVANCNATTTAAKFCIYQQQNVSGNVTESCVTNNCGTLDNVTCIASAGPCAWNGKACTSCTGNSAAITSVSVFLLAVLAAIIF